MVAGLRDSGIRFWMFMTFPCCNICVRFYVSLNAFRNEFRWTGFSFPTAAKIWCEHEKFGHICLESGGIVLGSHIGCHSAGCNFGLTRVHSAAYGGITVCTICFEQAGFAGGRCFGRGSQNVFNFLCGEHGAWGGTGIALFPVMARIQGPEGGLFCCRNIKNSAGRDERSK